MESAKDIWGEWQLMRAVRPQNGKACVSVLGKKSIWFRVGQGVNLGDQIKTLASGSAI